MYSKQEFAIILPDEKGVHNVVAVQNYDNPTIATMIVHRTFNEDAYVVECSQFNIELPTIYKGGYFYNIKTTPVYDKDGKVLENKTEEIKCEIVLPPLIRMDRLEYENTRLLGMLSSIIGGVK
nr:MAG TPA: hypothetical protein [Caudoviricetes sp.]